MAKMHTRAKRKFCVRSHTHYKVNTNKPITQKRAKTFSNEDAANTWAKAQGLSKYELVNLKFDTSKVKKIKVVALA
jgi:hypothetical protein